MSVSFTGIKNLNTKASQYEQYGAYRTPDGDIGKGMKNVTYVDISYDVNDDKSGNDHDKYIQALSESNKFELLNSQNPNNVRLQMKLDKIKSDTAGEFYNVSFKLNNHPIAMNNDKDLKLFQYLADMTRDKLQKSDEARTFDTQMLDMTNKGITHEAMDYFDCNPENE